MDKFKVIAACLIGWSFLFAIPPLFADSKPAPAFIALSEPEFDQTISSLETRLHWVKPVFQSQNLAQLFDQFTLQLSYAKAYGDVSQRIEIYHLLKQGIESLHQPEDINDFFDKSFPLHEPATLPSEVKNGAERRGKLKKLATILPKSVNWGPVSDQAIQKSLEKFLTQLKALKNETQRAGRSLEAKKIEAIEFAATKLLEDKKVAWPQANETVGRKLKRIFSDLKRQFNPHIFLGGSWQQPKLESDKTTEANSDTGYFKSKNVDIFPVPVFETRPDKGNSYGLMPIVILSDKKDDSIKALFGAVGQYNTVTKMDGALLAYFYPEEESEILFFGELGQDYARELSVKFTDPHLTSKIFLDGNISYIKSPFGHFFGIGPQREKSDRSNYVSEQFLAKATVGYYLTPTIRANWGNRIQTTDIQSRAMDQYDDTLTTYGGLPQVHDSTNWVQDYSLVFDNRPKGPYSPKGTFAKVNGFFSTEALGSDDTFGGWGAEFIQLLPVIENRWGMAFHGNFQRVFGDDTPFYELSSIGGPNELRSFTPGRFVDNGKIAFSLEQRIRLFKVSMLGFSFDTYADPFIEVGRVFNAVSDLGFKYWQPVGGVGLRIFVPPNLVARLDIAVGSDGMEMYTTLGYPF